MKGMKEAAPAEVGAIRKRTIRSLAMGRINEQQCSQIVSHLDEIDKLIKELPEEA